MNDLAPPSFGRHARRILFAWLALIALMLGSLASAHLRLGPWNVVIGLGVAALKSAIVLTLYMHLLRGGTLLRIVAGAGLFTLALLFGLTEVDYGTRVTEPTTMQQPQLVRPLRQGGAVR
jgi:cytochrome c oxidase subunit 4